MTLIIEHISNNSIIQAGDRLITQDDHHGIQEVEVVSNKAIVFEASDAVMSISYAGNAVFDDKTTDHWLAELITGEAISQSFPKGIKIGPMNAKPQMSLSEIFFKFWQALSVPKKWGLKLAHWYGFYFQLSITGWRWNHRYYQPFILRIGKPAGSWQLRRKFQTMPIDKRGQSLWSWFPFFNMTKEEFHDIADDIQSKSLHFGMIEDAFARGIQRVSRREPRVGSHSITISILNPKYSRAVNVRYHSPENETLTYQLSPNGDSIRVMTTPWIIGRRVTKPPQAMSGGATFSTGSFKVQCHAPTNEGSSTVFSSSSLPRFTDNFKCGL